jgi:hypothetical protein
LSFLIKFSITFFYWFIKLFSPVYGFRQTFETSVIKIDNLKFDTKTKSFYFPKKFYWKKLYFDLNFFNDYYFNVWILSKINENLKFFKANKIINYSYNSGFCSKTKPIVMEKPNESQIDNFFKDWSIFIAGATGFMSKVLVEKLIRSCDGVKNIYLLLRDKKGLNARSRLDEISYLTLRYSRRLRRLGKKTLRRWIN